MQTNQPNIDSMGNFVTYIVTGAVMSPNNVGLGAQRTDRRQERWMCEHDQIDLGKLIHTSVFQSKYS